MNGERFNNEQGGNGGFDFDNGPEGFNKDKANKERVAKKWVVNKSAFKSFMALTLAAGIAASGVTGVVGAKIQKGIDEKKMAEAEYGMEVDKDAVPISLGEAVNDIRDSVEADADNIEKWRAEITKADGGDPIDVNDGTLGVLNGAEEMRKEEISHYEIEWKNKNSTHEYTLFKDMEGNCYKVEIYDPKTEATFNVPVDADDEYGRVYGKITNEKMTIAEAEASAERVLQEMAGEKE